VQELPESLGIAVQRGEDLAPVPGLVLRLPAVKRVGERAPERVQTGVSHLEHPADVGRARAIEEERRVRCVAVGAIVALEHAERDQRVEEVHLLRG
jgi:hypothetical protein